jgi:hypothetical protein
MKYNLLILLYINNILCYNLYSVIYPIKHTFKNVNNRWNFDNKLLSKDKYISRYIGKWYYYNNINFLNCDDKIIYEPEYNKLDIVLSEYKFENSNIKSTKIFNKSKIVPEYYKKNKRYYDNNKEYYKYENINRIIKLKHTNYYKKLDKKANILKTIVVRPNHCSVTCTPYIPENDVINKLIDNNNINTTNYTISFNIWLSDNYIYNNSIKTGIYLSYDGINGNLKEFILKKENLIDDNININEKINIEEIYKSYNIIKYNLSNKELQNIKDFDDYNSTINYIILKNDWTGNYRIHNIYNDNINNNQITWSAEHIYFIPISNNEISKYYQLKFNEGIYINIPKNLKLFNDEDNIYIEFVSFFKNGTGIQRFLAWGNKKNGGIKTFCHDIWKKRNLYLIKN